MNCPCPDKRIVMNVVTENGNRIITFTCEQGDGYFSVSELNSNISQIGQSSVQFTFLDTVVDYHFNITLITEDCVYTNNSYKIILPFEYTVIRFIDLEKSVICGCTDSSASNYNPQAEFDDGSCEQNLLSVENGNCQCKDISLHITGDVDFSTDDAVFNIEAPTDCLIGFGTEQSDLTNNNFITIGGGIGGQSSVSWNIIVKCGDCVYRGNISYDLGGNSQFFTVDFYETFTSHDITDCNNCDSCGIVNIEICEETDELGDHSFYVSNQSQYDGVITIFGDVDGNPFTSTSGQVSTNNNVNELVRVTHVIFKGDNNCEYRLNVNWRKSTDESTPDQSVISCALHSMNLTSICGCTNPNASNYNPSAEFDDGSCIFIISGCTDPSASNYNISATVDDGSCVFNIGGCTDPNADNYNPSAEFDDGSCNYCKGCTDQLAYNYNPDAIINDGSCLYTFGCTNPIATNYNPNAVIEDGSCICGDILIPLGQEYYIDCTVEQPCNLIGNTSGFTSQNITGTTLTSGNTLSGNTNTILEPIEEFNIKLSYLLEIKCQDLLDCYLKQCTEYNGKIESLGKYLSELSLEIEIFESDNCNLKESLGLLYVDNIFQDGFYLSSGETCLDIIRCEDEQYCDLDINKFNLRWKDIEIKIPKSYYCKNIIPVIRLKNFDCEFNLLIKNYELNKLFEDTKIVCRKVDDCVGFDLQRTDKEQISVVADKCLEQPDYKIIHENKTTIGIDPIYAFENNFKKFIKKKYDVEFNNLKELNNNYKKLFVSLYDLYNETEICDFNYDISEYLEVYNLIDNNVLNFLENNIPTSVNFKSNINKIYNPFDLNDCYSHSNKTFISGDTYDIQCTETVLLCDTCDIISKQEYSLTADIINNKYGQINNLIIQSFDKPKSECGKLFICCDNDVLVNLHSDQDCILTSVNGVDICTDQTLEFDCFYIKYINNTQVIITIKKQCCGSTFTFDFETQKQGVLVNNTYDINVVEDLGVGNDATIYICVE